MVWEDIKLLYRGLEITSDDNILSITSAGCNVLGLLLKEPQTITALDVNPAQSALLEIKIAAIKNLSYLEFIRFLGFRSAKDRLLLYHKLRKDLSDQAMRFWDAQTKNIGQGICHCGRLEKYFLEFQKKYLSKIHSLNTILKLLQFKNIENQEAFFKQTWGTKEFVKVFTMYFSQENMAMYGRDPSQFRYVTLNAGDQFIKKFRQICTTIPLLGNFYMEFFLTSQFRNLYQIHPYLMKKNYFRLRSLLDRVTIITCDLESFVHEIRPGVFSKANFSDVFEYMSENSFIRIFDRLHPLFRKGGRIAYWDLLVKREIPDRLRIKYQPHFKKSKELWNRDRSWFYRDFHLEEVI